MRCQCQRQILTNERYRVIQGHNHGRRLGFSHKGLLLHCQHGKLCMCCVLRMYGKHPSEYTQQGHLPGQVNELLVIRVGVNTDSKQCRTKEGWIR